VHELQTQVGNLTRENASLKEDIEAYEETLSGYRVTIEDKCAECVELREEVESLKKHISSANQGGGWSQTLSSLLPRSKDAEKNQDEQLAKLQEKLARYRKFASNLESENLQLRQKTAQQEQQIQDQVIEFARELDEMKRETSIEVPTIPDTEIQGEWKSLGCLIRQFIMKHLGGPLDLSTVQQAAQTKTFCWLPEMAKALQSPLLRPIVLESWIWHLLCFGVFDSQSTFWAGDIGKSFSVPCDQIRGESLPCFYLSRSRLSLTHVSGLLTLESVSKDQPNKVIERFHDWRVRSAHFISSLEVHNKDQMIEATTRTMLSTLRMITSSTISQGQLISMQQDASGILHKAAELDRLFRLSKADFHVFITRIKLPLVSPPSFGFVFDPETMERIRAVPGMQPANSEPTVDLAVSPGILKAGNADGVNYGAERVLVKLQALCDLQAVLALFDTAGEAQSSGNKQAPEVKAERVYIKQEDAGGDDEVCLLNPKPEEMGGVC
jgi:hypothetical protein